MGIIGPDVSPVVVEQLQKVRLELKRVGRLTYKEIRTLTKLTRKPVIQIMEMLASEYETEVTYIKSEPPRLVFTPDRRSPYAELDPKTWPGYKPDSAIAEALGCTTEEIFMGRIKQGILGWIEYLPRSLDGYDDLSDHPEDPLVAHPYAPLDPPATYLMDKIKSRRRLSSRDPPAPGIRYYIEDHAPASSIPVDRVRWSQLVWVIHMRNKR